MIKEMLDKTMLPEFPYKSSIADTKAAMLKLLLNEEYGVLPNREKSLSYEVVSEDEKFAAGKAVLKTVNITANFESGSFTFPVRSVIPKRKTNVPFFVHINFRPNIPDAYQPTEEIIDNGFAVLSFCYKEVTSDDSDFSNGVSPYILGANERINQNDCGKIAMWAWAASRTLDYALSINELDKTKAAVVGHSRLGKTALLAGAVDERFSLVISNNSGCGGAAISRGKQGETIDDILRVFPFWFCKNFEKYRKNECAMPFDQHYLLACAAPRKLYVSSANDDLWADPEREFLCCAKTDEYYKHFGLTGFNVPDKIPGAGECVTGADIGYHKRSGLHYLSREDWLHFIEFAKKVL